MLEKRTTPGFIGFGMSAGSRVVTNEEMGKMVGMEPEEIFRKTGIRERRWVDSNETTSGLAIAAAQALLTNTNIDLNLVDQIIVATNTPEIEAPGVSYLVQAALDAPEASSVFDVRAACHGSLVAYMLACHFRTSEAARPDGISIIIGAETMTKISPLGEKGSILFSDGAGAAAMGLGEADFTPTFSNYSAGKMANAIFVSPQTGRIIMNGKLVREAAVEHMTQACRQVLTKTNLSISDIDLVVVHQANEAMIMKPVWDNLEVPQEKRVSIIAEYGNTSAASIPMALAKVQERGELRPGAKLLLVAIGSGMGVVATVIPYIGAK
jgi:3-oxoacyl-[acyl-carrier-protein] synthase III